MSDALLQGAEWLSASWQFFSARPFLLIFSFLAPLGILAAILRTFPERRLVELLALVATTSLVMLIADWLVIVVLIIDALLLTIAAIDLFSLPRKKYFRVERQMLKVASLDRPHEVHLELRNLSKRSWKIKYRDDLPQACNASPFYFDKTIPPRTKIENTYELTASQRGAMTLEHIYLQVSSRWGLWKRFFKYPCKNELHVYPNMKQLSEYALLARTNRLSLIGVRRTRKVGQDSDFERLRDYTSDDNFRHMDWRATARRNKLTVRDFQVNQSQRLVFVMDCGRMMTNYSNGLSILDHAFNSMLMLSFIALKQGDSVGMLCFSDEIEHYVPPQSGMSQMNRLLHGSFDRFPNMVESRYDEAFLYLNNYCRKRSLVVLMSSFIDEVNANQLHQYLSNLVGNHLPIGVLLRDHQMFRAADVVDPQGHDLYRAAAASDVLLWRQQVLSQLQHSGVLTIDSFPEDLTAPLINQYMEIKARHLL
ncbi:MAG: DUF58 domain-containing protein [Pirellulaceae bacterium]|nr:DUF58 domain-containing protein [Pirellulaceae bacterium]